MDRIKRIFTKSKITTFIIVIIFSAFAFTACNKSDKSESTTEAPTTTKEEEETTTETPTTEEPTTESEPELPFINPLTGERTTADYSNVRPVAVMLNTIKEALPQSGNSKADIFIEMAEEGGISRILGIYQDVTGVGTIGSVRSTREYFLSWTRAFDGILVHAGGDSWVLNEIQSSGYRTITHSNPTKDVFWRDSERLQYLNREHTLYTSSDKLQNWISTSDFPATHTKQDYTQFTFTDELDDSVMTQTANSVSVAISGYKNTTFNYNEDTGKYDVYFWNNEPYMDEADGTQVTVSNILVMTVPNWNDVDAWGVYRQKYDLSGGKGYYISGGKYTEMNWTKGNYNVSTEYGNPLTLTDMQGEPLALSVGKTYICVIADKYGVTFGE